MKTPKSANRSIYNKYFALNENGRQICQEISEAIRPIFEKYYADGYNPVELGELISSEAGFLMAEARLTFGLELKKREKAEKKAQEARKKEKEEEARKREEYLESLTYDPENKEACSWCGLIGDCGHY